MTQTLPDKDMGTCLLTACQAKSGHQIHLHNLGKSGNLLAKSLTLHADDDTTEKTIASALLTYIGGRQIIHFAESQAIEVLQHLVISAGYKPVDNAVHDAAPLARAFCRVSGLPCDPTLDDFAELRGFTQDDRIAAEHDAAVKLRLLHDVWATFILSPLGYSRTLEAHAVSEPRRISDIDMSLHGLPLPAPIVPQVRVPASGWRRTRWGEEEAQDCAFRFVEGAGLEELSSLFRRSPRAIQARLVLDGILQIQ